MPGEFSNQQLWEIIQLLLPPDSRISAHPGLQEHRVSAGEDVELYEDDFHWNCQQQQGNQGGYNEYNGTSQSLIFPIQATEGIIKHLEKVDAEPEEDDFMKEDETTDFTLFEVVYHLIYQSVLLQSFDFRFPKMTQIQRW